MSRHHKNLTLGALNDTWDEMIRLNRRQEERIKQVRNEALTEASRVAKTETERAKAEMDRRLKREVNDLERRTNSRLADLDRKHSENLRRATDHIYDNMERSFDNMSRALEAEAQHLNGRIDKVQQWTKENLDIIDRNMRQLQQETNQQLAAQQQEIEGLQLDVKSIFDRFQNEATMAKDIAHDTTQLLQVVRENYPVERYTPCELRDVNEQVNSLANSKYPAASVIAVADRIIRDILRMKEKAAMEKAKHDALLRDTKARLSAILKVIGDNVNQTLERDGESATIATDFWTDGAYSRLQEQLRQIERQLDGEEQRDALTTEDIADLLKQMEQLNLDGVALMQRAVNRALQSQDRAEITLDIVNAMIRQGYEVKTEKGEGAFDYMGGQIDSDQREGVFAILRNPVTGEEISVILRPNADEKTNNIDIQVDNPNQTMTEQHLRNQISRISKELEASGYTPGPIQVPVDGGDEIVPEMQSGSDLRRSGAAERLRRRIGG